MPELRPITILLVEDDVDSVELTKRTLLESGIVNNLEVAHTGNDALRLIGSIRPSVVLLDWNLPDCSGCDVFRAIKSSLPGVDIIVMSAVIPEHIDDEIPDYFMLKPFDAVQFIMILKSMGGLKINIVEEGVY